MTLLVRIEMAGKPRGKAAPRVAPGQVRPHKEPNSARYESQLRYAAQQAMEGRPPTLLPVLVDLVAVFEIGKSWAQWKQEAALAGHLLMTQKPDYDNLQKMLDALTGVVWKDDAQVIEARVRKDWGMWPVLTIAVATAEAPPLGAAKPATPQLGLQL